MIKENKIYSKVIDNFLLHKTIFFDSNPVEKFNRINLSEDKEFLQASYIEMNHKHTFEAHQHKYQLRPPEKVIAQETWIIIDGKVMVDYFDIDGSHLQSQLLNRGDLTITFYGGHTYTSLDENTHVYEIKTGPYTDQHTDKIRYSDPNWKEYKSMAINDIMNISSANSIYEATILKSKRN